MTPDHLAIFFAGAGVGLTGLNIVLSRAVAIGAYKQQHKQLTEDMATMSEKIESIMPSVREFLFVSSGDQKGRTVYIPRSECEKETARCHDLVCGKMDSLGNRIEKLDMKIESNRNETQKKLDDIYHMLYNHVISNGDNKKKGE